MFTRKNSFRSQHVKFLAAAMLSDVKHSPKTIANPTRVWLIALMLFLVSNSSFFAQASFITQSSTTYGQLDAAQQERVDWVQNYLYTESSQIVDIGDLATLASLNGTFQVIIPGDSELYNAIPIRVEAESTSHYNWMGELFNSCDENVGDITLVKRADKISGHFETYDVSYELIALDNNFGILQKIDPNAFDIPECHPIDLSEAFQKPDQNGVGSRNGTNCDVRVLVVYGAAAAVNDFDVDQLAALAITQTNQAFTNSAVDQKVVLAGVEQVGFASTGDMENDLSTITMDNEIMGLRANYDADLVIYISNNLSYAFAGLTYLFPSPNMAYAIVERSNATSTFTFTHEIGHLFGCNHQQCSLTQTASCTSDAGFNHGYRYNPLICQPYYPGNWGGYPSSTTMHVLTKTYPRKLRFSNPDVLTSTLGIPTGLQNRNDNAQIIENNGCDVSCFWQDSPLSVSISGPHSGYVGQNIALLSNVSGGIPPYQYLWELSTDGINYTSQVGTDPFLVYTLYFPEPSKFLFFRLKVTDSNGQEAFAFKHVLVSFALIGSGNTGAQSAVLVNSFPNPAQRKAIVEFDVLEPTQLEIELFDEKGKSLLSIADGKYEVGRYQQGIELNTLHNGVYFCRLTTNDGVQTQRVVVIK